LSTDVLFTTTCIASFRSSIGPSSSSSGIWAFETA
jgi:hypothetical protein